MAVGKMSFGVGNSSGNDVSSPQPYRSQLDLIGFNPYHIRYVTVLPFLGVSTLGRGKTPHFWNEHG